MRVLHINCNYIGTALHSLMVAELEKLGYESCVFVPTYDKSKAVIDPGKNVIVSECFKKWDRILFDYKQKKIFGSVEKNCNAGSFDLIHAYTLFTDGNCARALSKKYGVPYVVAVRNTDVNSFFRFRPHLRTRGVKIMYDAAAVFFLSEAYRDQVFEKYIPKKYQSAIRAKTHIISNGIDDFWLSNIPETDNEINGCAKLIYAGRIDKNKNIPTIQKAMAILRGRGCDTTLTVVGKVADQKLFSRIKKNSHTVCVPAQPKEELIKLYRQSNIFVMPSYTESFGLVYAEAMSQGLPVVYSKGQGFDGQFDEGSVGYHVSAYDPIDVADGICNVIKNFDVLTKNVVSCARTFEWKKIAKKYDVVYRTIKPKTET